jgi:hypothetical protein
MQVTIDEVSAAVATPRRDQPRAASPAKACDPEADRHRLETLLREQQERASRVFAD